MTPSQHDDNYFQSAIDGGDASHSADEVLDGGGAYLPADTPVLNGGNAGTRHLGDSQLAKEGGYGFPKGLPTAIKLKLHELLNKHGVTLKTLESTAADLANQLKPLLEQRYGFEVTRLEALVEQVKTDATAYLATQN